MAEVKIGGGKEERNVRKNWIFSYLVEGGNVSKKLKRVAPGIFLLGTLKTINLSESERKLENRKGLQ